MPEIYQKDYRGLTLLPFASYYDNFWNFITEDSFALIKSNFEKCKCLLLLLSQEKSRAFIEEIITAVGGASQEDFNVLFARYFQEIPQFKSKIKKTNLQNNLIKLHYDVQHFKSDSQQLKARIEADLLSIKAEMQWTKNTINVQFKELNTVKKHLQKLTIEKKMK